MKGLSLETVTLGRTTLYRKWKSTQTSTLKARRCLLPRGRRPWHAWHWDYAATWETLRLFQTW